MLVFDYDKLDLNKVKVPIRTALVIDFPLWLATEDGESWYFTNKTGVTIDKIPCGEYQNGTLILWYDIYGNINYL